MCSAEDAKELSVRVGWADLCTLETGMAATVGDVSILSTTSDHSVRVEALFGGDNQKRRWTMPVRHYGSTTQRAYLEDPELYSTGVMTGIGYFPMEPRPRMWKNAAYSPSGISDSHFTTAADALSSIADLPLCQLLYHVTEKRIPLGKVGASRTAFALGGDSGAPVVDIGEHSTHPNGVVGFVKAELSACNSKPMEGFLVPSSVALAQAQKLLELAGRPSVIMWANDL